MIRDDFEVPKEILDAADKIDQWATNQGMVDYAIGPIKKRFGGNIERDIKEIRDRIKKIESALVL